MSGGELFVLVALAVVVFWMLGAYNRLMSLRNAVGSAWQQVDEAIARRGAALSSMVSALRTPMGGEGAALDALLTGHAQVSAAADALRLRPVRAEQAAALVRAEAALVSASTRVLSLLDLQPPLRDGAEVAPLLQTLHEVQPRLEFARQLFNDAVRAYNDALGQFPTRLLARLYGFGPAGTI